MNKKVKWSVISVTTGTFLAFAGLVTGNEKEKNQNAGLQPNTTLNDEGSDSFNQFSDEGDGGGFGRHRHGSGEWDIGDQGSMDDGEQIFQAPSDGFEQGHGSSGPTK
ncbi:hypothetical protein [Falsibacillus pallidus]|uniref:hypothetical protein n=1 Tax=Falsibacillus pallidus TaxID=493781 RepID=UPI003D9899DF